MHNQKPSLSIVILCYRAGEFVRDFVAKTIKTLEDHAVDDYELVLVGNYIPGTDDPTPRVVQELSQKNPRIICSAKPKQGMMGWDMRSGLELTTGDYIAVIDGDGQMPISDVIKGYDIIRQGDVDFVKTYRLTRDDGLFRKILSFFYNLIFHILFPGLHARDINSKPKIMTRRAYRKLDLQSDDWFIDAEIMIQVRRYKIKIREIQTTFSELRTRRSFVNTKAIFEFLKNLAVYRFREFKKRDSA